ncbi:MAG: arginase [Desulfobulbaceae bacterium]|nr:arginase [Desulfobulbaceae bacterium]
MEKRTVRIIGIPIDLGQQHRGVDIGPVAIRYAGLAGALRNLGYRTEDLGNIDVPGHYTLVGTSYAERLPLIRAACETTYGLARDAIRDGTVPIFLGGDHSAAIGSIGGVTHDAACGIVWIDAHGDFNTPETSQSCNIHGMALAILLGRGPRELVDVGRLGAKLKADQVVLIGVRDLDRREREHIRESGCTIFTMRDIDEIGMHGVLQKTMKILSRFERIHISLDMDGLDANEAPGVGTPVPGGLTYREAQLLMETICDTGRLNSLDIMETNPILDISNRTAQTAVSLASSLFGKRIL